MTSEGEIVPIAEEQSEASGPQLIAWPANASILRPLKGPQIEMTRSFVLENLGDNWSHYVAALRSGSGLVAIEVLESA
jgi:hypothetical protein